MKIDRLLAIAIYLLNHDKTSAKELMEKFEVSKRTIQRDMESLSMAGIPVTSELGVNGGYFILDSYKMKCQLMGKDEYSYLTTALRGLLSAYDNSVIDGLLEKIITLSPDKGHNSGIVLDFRTLRENQEVSQKIEYLEEAIKRKCLVSFSYTNADNHYSKHEMEPIIITYKWYAWYLYALDPQKASNEYRMYKLIRMENLELLNKSITKEYDTEELLKKIEEAVDKRVYLDIRLRCKADVRVKAVEYLNGTIIEEFDNGDFIMEINVPENEHFWFGTILALGNSAEVLEPSILKERIKKKCLDMLNLYQ